MALTTMNGTIIPNDLKGIPKFRIYKNTSCDDYPLHWHTGVEIVLPLENRYRVIHGNEIYDLMPDELCFINSGAMHQLAAPKTKGVRIFIQFDLTLLYNLSEFDMMFSLLPPVLKMTEESHGETYRQVLVLVKEIIREYNDDKILRDATIYSDFIRLFLTVFKNEIHKRKTGSVPDAVNTKKNEHVRKLLSVCRYVNDHFTECLTLEGVADQFNFSKYHFSRLFKDFTHATFHQYLNNLRVTHAETLLANCELSVLDVALMSGFNSISTFNRVFKDQKLISPTDYRKKYASANAGFADSFAKANVFGIKV